MACSNAGIHHWGTQLQTCPETSTYQPPLACGGRGQRCVTVTGSGYLLGGEQFLTFHDQGSITSP